MAADETWAGMARATRDALALLGHPVDIRCLPDEAEPCGGSFALHCAAYFGTLAAITDHQLEHLGPEFIEAARECADGKTAEIEATCTGSHE